MSGSRYLKKNGILSRHKSYLVCSGCLIRAFFAIYTVGASGVQEQSGDPQEIGPVHRGAGGRVTQVAAQNVLDLNLEPPNMVTVEERALRDWIDDVRPEFVHSREFSI